MSEKSLLMQGPRIPTMDDETACFRFIDGPGLAEPIMNVQAAASNRLTANRRLFLGAYAVLGLLSTFVYLSQVNVPFLAITALPSGVSAILIALPAILPYVVSGAYAWQLISGRRLGLYLFLVATVIGTVVANLVISGVIDIHLNAESIFWYALGQTAVYGLAAEFLLRIEWP